MSEYKIKTPCCMACGQYHDLTVDAGDADMMLALEMYRMGAFVQDAFPFLSADQREQIMTGMNQECWNRMVGEEV